MTIQEQLESFQDFAREQIERGVDSLSLSCLVDMWMVQNPSARRSAADLAAIREAIEDLENGDRGRPADEVTREVCEELGLEVD